MKGGLLGSSTVDLAQRLPSISPQRCRSPVIWNEEVEDAVKWNGDRFVPLCVSYVNQKLVGGSVPLIKHDSLPPVFLFYVAAARDITGYDDVIHQALAGLQHVTARSTCSPLKYASQPNHIYSTLSVRSAVTHSK